MNYPPANNSTADSSALVGSDPEISQGQRLPLYDCVLWQSFGGPEAPGDVMEFLRNVTRGRNIPDERLALVADQYQLFGGVSNINAQNRSLIGALDAELKRRGSSLPIYFGNRNWAPYISDTVSEMISDGRRHALVFTTSAYGSYSACKQYREDLAGALSNQSSPTSLTLHKLRHYYNHPHFIESITNGILAKCEEGFAIGSSDSAVIATAHSIPLDMGGRRRYETQLGIVREELERQLERHGLPPVTIIQSYQSRSGSPRQPWLEPDISQVISDAHRDGVRSVLVVPIGFISDHQEVRYDLDTQAKATADALGVTFYRSATASGDPLFITMVADLIDEVRQGTPMTCLDGVVSGFECPPDCCEGPLS